MSSSKCKFEEFFVPSAAINYSVERSRMVRVLKEMFLSAHKLHDHYSVEIQDVEQFRAELSSSLSSDGNQAKVLAERWGFFSKRARH